jgi:A/G-specific adenine glycosylase
VSSFEKWGFARALAEWYRREHRELPWRQTRDPYRVWVSEVMLQQTQVRTVLPYYERFLAAFPTVQALAAAPEERVQKLWEGLGYYARCRHLHAAAQRLVAEHGGAFPTTLAAVRALPGIGRSTAGAILTFALGQRHPVLDGNVKRVLARVFDIDEDVGRARVERRLWGLSEALLAVAEAPDEHNQALMELGALVCTPRRPACPSCPVGAHCEARERGTQAQRPVRRRRGPVPHHHIAVGVIWDGARLLIQRRQAQGLLGGLWEFPGGKREQGESFDETVAREVREELGLEVQVDEQFATVRHAYSHFRITMHAFHCRYLGGEPVPKASQEVRWVALEQLEVYAFPKANRALLEVLTERR